MPGDPKAARPDPALLAIPGSNHPLKAVLTAVWRGG